MQPPHDEENEEVGDQPEETWEICKDALFQVSSMNRVKGPSKPFTEVPEVWKPSPEDSRYRVSNRGRVKGPQGIMKNTDFRDPTTPFPNKYVSFVVKKGKTLLAHRQTALLFVSGRTAKKIVVNHKNGIRWDNRAENLEWVTHQENRQRMVFPCLKRKGVKVVQLTLDGEYVATWNSHKEAASSFGFSTSCLSVACGHPTKTFAKHRWLKFEEYQGGIPGEKWRSITYNGTQYRVSTEGRVKIDEGKQKGRVVGSNHAGYIKHNGNFLHRVAAETFPKTCPKAEGKDIVNHKNGNKTDNRPKNLEWVTHQENCQHAHDTGLCELKVPVVCMNDNGDDLYLFDGYSSAALEMAGYKGGGSNISLVCGDESRSSYGYRWRPATKEDRGVLFLKAAGVHPLDSGPTRGGRSVSVVCVSTEGVDLYLYESVVAAALEFGGKAGGSIFAMLRKEQDTAHGYKWRAGNPEDKGVLFPKSEGVHPLDTGPNLSGPRKAVVCIFGGKRICWYESASDAAEGVHKSTKSSTSITAVCNGRQVSAYKCVWEKATRADESQLPKGPPAVVCMDKKRDVLYWFPNAAEAAFALTKGKSRDGSEVDRACRGEAKSALGRSWRFAEKADNSKFEYVDEEYEF